MTHYVQFNGVQYVRLKESIHVINNFKPPLAVSVPISGGGWISAVDTTFIAYGASLDTGIDVMPIKG